MNTVIKAKEGHDKYKESIIFMQIPQGIADNIIFFIKLEKNYFFFYF